MKKYKISYFYLATGMEGIADQFPEKIIEAETKELACYIYYLMFFTDFYEKFSFNQYISFPEYEKTWGLSIEEISEIQ